MAKIKGITVQIGADTKGLEAALKDVNSQANKLRGELKDIEKQLKFEPHNVELWAQKQKVLNEQIETTRDKLSRLKEVQAQVNQQFQEGKIGEEQYRVFQRELIKTESQLKEYEKALKEVNLQSHEFNQKMQEALEGVNKASREISQELQEVERLLKFNPHDTELLAQKQKLLADQVENTREKLNELKEVQVQVNQQFQEGKISEEQYRALQRELVETESQLKNYEKQLRAVNLQNHEFNQKMQEMGDKLKKAGESMVATGKTLSTHLTVPLTALGTLAAKSAIDFESAFAGVA